MSEKKRVPYYDIAKAILIIFVVIHHFLWYSHSLLNFNNPTCDFLFKYQGVFLCFFMPGFFFVTGVCSNFNKPFKVFILNNFKTLIVPSIIFTILTRLYAGSYNHLNLTIVRSTIVDLILYGGHFWFLQALFVSKLIYWFLCKLLHRQRTILLACLLIAIGGCILEQHNLFPNFWFHRHAMDLCLFIALGMGMKQHLHTKFFQLASLIFILSICALLFSDVRIPYLTRTFAFELSEYPLHVFLATTGSITTIYLSKLIYSNRVLEYLGRASLIVYVCHITFCIQPLLSVSRPLLENSNHIGVSLIVLVTEIVITLGLCSLVYRVINTKYLKWIIGK